MGNREQRYGMLQVRPTDLFSVLFLSLFFLFLAYKKEDGQKKDQIKYLLVALIISYGGAIDFFSISFST